MTDNNSVFSLRKQSWESFKCTNLQLRRKQSQGKLPSNTRQSEHICQMSEIGRGCVALCVFLILWNKGPLFPREAAGRNLALWLALVALLCSAFSYISWYHPLQQQLMRQDTRQQPHRTKHPASTLLLLYTHTYPAKIPTNNRDRGLDVGNANNGLHVLREKSKSKIKHKYTVSVHVCV